jgi:uncharacterized phiE125 gp8 family phage protein
MALNRITAPTTEPVSLAEAKLHLRVDDSTDDALIGVLIQAAREAAENHLGRSLMPQVWELTRDAFPADDGELRLRMGPVTGIVSVTYTDTASATQTLDAAKYSLDAKSLVAWLLPAYGESWPDTLRTANAVTVTYAAGYADAATVPASVKAWMLVQIGHWYANREATTERALTPLPFVDNLLYHYVVPSIA